MAKLRIFIVLAICAGFAFSLGSCHKSKSREYVELDTDSGVIKHFDFQVGTYWVYVDAFSGRTDSFYVRSNVYTPQTETYNVYDYHFITIAELNIDNSNPGDSANWVFNYQGTDIMMDYDYTTFAWGWKNEIEFRPLFKYPFAYGNQYGQFDTVSITQVDSAFSVNGLTFYKVAHVYHYSNADSTEGPNITKLQDMFYISDSVGMVEITLNHPYHNINRDWQLLRYKIVK